jgi:hypothetical protein
MKIAIAEKMSAAAYTPTRKRRIIVNTSHVKITIDTFV